ncbi:four-helix bundle copper-binding protein [Salinactinospora qingdaonensis]|uniref:Four-helix bundle copper-binding protein n=1 Tax=Salinactinospora qingdaonensis TaxID=702744 RepID=A0ABP7FK51_9ACTN
MATQTEHFLREHPRDPVKNVEPLRTCVERLAACAQACTACADACLGEADSADLVACIRRNLDCADLCGTAEQVLTRRTEANVVLDRAILQACVQFCEHAAQECGTHAASHEHCRLCADTCVLCAEACRDMLATL